MQNMQKQPYWDIGLGSLYGSFCMFYMLTATATYNDLTSHMWHFISAFIIKHALLLGSDACEAVFHRTHKETLQQQQQQGTLAYL